MALHTIEGGGKPVIPAILDPWRDVIHPAALILPRPNASDYADLKQSVERHGLLSPLSTFVDKAGEHWLLDGVSRLQVLVELGQPVLDPEGRWAVATLPYYEEQGVDPYEIAVGLNVKRRHLTPEQKRDVIRALREERPELSDRAIARMAGASAHTVADERRSQAAEAETEAVPAETPEASDEDGYAEGALEEAGEGEGEGAGVVDGEPVAPVEPPPVRREETGRRARGRRPGQRPVAEPPITLPTRPFIGTVLPSAPKSSRVAEAKRCVKYLQLRVGDLQPRV